MLIKLPWINPQLSPNARIHWAHKAKLIKADRNFSHFMAEAEKRRVNWVAPEGNIPVKITFHPPDKRRRDLDNAIASMKGATDGIAQALGVDDSVFVPTYKFGDVVKGGRVTVEL